ncbi:MAG: class I SAM-dependent methyltransferase [Magnetococcales bacterium]|nr:class I SAM-dependent methyltransferase [Magnetococcales bacterium]
MTPSNPPSPLRMTPVSCPGCAAQATSILTEGKDFEYATSDDTFTMVRCDACRLVHLNPRPHASELERIYPPHYLPYQFDQRGGTMLRVRQWLQRGSMRAWQAHISPTADILDAGCGGAGFLDLLRRHGSPDWKLWGNDIGPAALEAVTKAGHRALPGRFEELDVPDGSFDLILFRQVIEHLDAPSRVIQRAARLLRPGGLLILETPNLDAWDPRLFQERYWGGYHFPRHWTLFDADTLGRLVREAGLQIHRVDYLLSPSFWIQSCHHLLMERGAPGYVSNFFHTLNPIVAGLAVCTDLAQRMISGRTSNMRMVCVRPH